MRSFTVTAEEQTFLVGIVGLAPAQGYTIAEARSAFRLLGLIEKSQGKVTLEEADWSILTQRLNAHRFPATGADLIELLDKVLDAKEQPA